MASPSPEVLRAVHDGAAWLEARELRNVEWPVAGPDGRQHRPKPGSGPLWSRNYDIATMRPIFGDRDKTIHDDVDELSAERRNGYAGSEPAPRAQPLSKLDGR